MPNGCTVRPSFSALQELECQKFKNKVEKTTTSTTPWDVDVNYATF
jgi:hypothetical protein